MNDLSIGRMRALCMLFSSMLCAAALLGCNESGDDGSMESGRKPKLGSKGLSSVDLAAPTAAGTGFVQLAGVDTGITFRNDVTDEELLLSTYTMASGLASADVDSDGDLDLFFCGIDSDNKLYRNDGGFKFTDVTEESGVPLAAKDVWTMSAAFVDLTGDGNLDLYVCNRNADNQFFIGDGKLGFKPDEAAGRGIASGKPSSIAAFFDAENDGDLDIYLMNYEPFPLNFERWAAGRIKDKSLSDDEHARVLKVLMTGKATTEDLPEAARSRYYVSKYGRVYPLPPTTEFLVNDGSGKFDAQTKNAGMLWNSWGLAAQASDLNNDGWTDLYLTSDFEVNDRMYINNKDGTFTDKATEYLRKVPWFSMGVDTGDINHDGLPDIMTSDMLSKDYKRAKRQSGDMNDGRDELLYDDPQPQMRNMLYVNRGGGHMTELGQMAGVASSEWTWTVRLADLNSDGRSEIYTSNGALYDVMDVDFKNERTKLDAMPNARALLVDMAKSQEPYWTDDFIFTTEPEDPLKFSQAEGNWGLKDGSMGCGASVADYDGDGDSDIIMNNTNLEAGVWRNDLPQGSQVLFDFRQDGANQRAVGTRVWLHVGEKTYMDDVIMTRGYATGESGRLHFGLGDATVIDKVEIRWPDLSLQAYENLPVGKLHTVTKQKQLPKWTPAPVETWFSQSVLPYKSVEKDTQRLEFAREPLLPIECSRFGTGAGSADYNGDGNLDVYFAGPAGMAGQLLQGDGKGGFAVDASFGGAFPAEAEEMAVLWFDANADKRLDLLVTAGGMEAAVGQGLFGAKLFLNQPNGLVAAPLPARDLSTGSAAAADVDGDGDLDLLLCGNMQPHAYLKSVPSALYLNDGMGVFTDATVGYLALLNQGRPISEAQFGEFNGDTRPDLVVARNFGSVELWTGDGKSFSKQADLTEPGMWRSLGLGDFDNDGDQDVLAGNLGKNTKYSPKPDQPVRLFAADFDKNGSRDLIEVKFAKIDGKTCAMPGRGRSCSGYAISYIPVKWPTWKSFADATLEDVYGEGLASAEKFEATNLASEMIINNGAGNFAASKLPGTAQWAPVFGIAVADFDGDSNLDAFLGNNFARPQPEAGNWQTGYGVLLKGDGKGGFVDVQPAEAGLFLERDSRSVLAADFNGDAWSDLLVSVSGAVSQLGTRGAALRSGVPLQVNLQGPAANPFGVGARLELSLSTGTKQSRTVQAGQGYLGSYAGPVAFAVPSGATATSLTVTWPDGEVSSTTDLAGSEITISR